MIELYFLITFGGLIAILFLQEINLSLKFNVISFYFLAVWGIITARSSQLAILQRLMIFLYAMPFSVTAGYIFNEDYNWGQTPLIQTLLSDQLVNTQIVVIGLVGLIGLLFGMKLGEIRKKYDLNSIRRIPGNIRFGKLGVLPFFVLLGVSLFFSYLSTPKELIFFTPYAAEGTEGISHGINFHAAGLISYLILILLNVDSEQEHKGKGIRHLKKASLMSVTLFIIVYFQLLRGSRECMGMITAFIALFITDNGPAGAIEKKTISVKVYYKRMRRMLIPGLIIFIVFVSLGSARFFLSSTFSKSYSIYDFIGEGFKNNTWTSVLLTNLGLALLVRDGQFKYLAGQTYMDYILSLPPGIMTQFMGIERPLEATSGPTWWFVGISGGGIHPVVVPFMNFGIFGVLIVLGIYGVLIVHFENLNTTRFYRFMYGTFIVSSYLWFWYGDMSFIRGIMSAVILWVLYRSIIRIRLN